MIISCQISRYAIENTFFGLHPKSGRGLAISGAFALEYCPASVLRPPATTSDGVT